MRLHESSSTVTIPLRETVGTMVTNGNLHYSNEKQVFFESKVCFQIIVKPLILYFTCFHVASNVFRKNVFSSFNFELNSLNVYFHWKVISIRQSGK